MAMSHSLIYRVCRGGNQCQTVRPGSGTARIKTRSRVSLQKSHTQIGDSEIGRTAQIAWDGLSRACHHHAYELQPTVDEVHGLVNLVRQIALAGSEVVRPIV